MQPTNSQSTPPSLSSSSSPRQQPASPAAHVAKPGSTPAAHTAKRNVKPVSFGQHRHRVPYDIYLAAVLSPEFNAAWVPAAALPMGGPVMFTSQHHPAVVGPPKDTALLHEHHPLDLCASELPRGGTSFWFPAAVRSAKPVASKHMPLEAIPVPWVLVNAICLLEDQPADNITTTTQAAVASLQRSTSGIQSEAATTAAAFPLSLMLVVLTSGDDVCLPEQQPGDSLITGNADVHLHGSTSDNQPHDATTHAAAAAEAPASGTQSVNAAAIQGVDFLSSLHGAKPSTVVLTPLKAASNQSLAELGLPDNTTAIVLGNSFPPCLTEFALLAFQQIQSIFCNGCFLLVGHICVCCCIHNEHTNVP